MAASPQQRRCATITAASGFVLVHTTIHIPETKYPYPSHITQSPAHRPLLAGGAAAITIPDITNTAPCLESGMKKIAQGVRVLARNAGPMVA